MAQLALGIAGGVLAFYTGGLSYVGLGFLGGSLIGSAVVGPPRGGPKLTDLHVTSSTYGAPIPWGWGTARIAGNVIWSYPLTQHSHSGGKGMGGGTYTYSWTGAVGLCSTEYTGPISRILKIWADTKLVYDCTGQSGLSKNIPGSGGGGKGGNGSLPNTAVVNGDVTSAFNKVGKFRVYTGTQDQLPDPALEALVGAANAQAHRGMAYIVFEDVDLTNYGQRVPNWTFEVAFSGTGVAQNAFKFNFDTSVLAYPTPPVVALDSFRRRAYFFNLGAGTDTNHGIYSMDLATGNTLMTSSWDRTFAGDGTYGSFGAGYSAIVADDGYIWLQAGGTGNRWYKIDPETLLAIGYITPTSSNGRYPVPLKLSYGNCLFVSGDFSSTLNLLNLDTLTVAATGTLTGGGLHAVHQFCGGNQIDTDNASVLAVTVQDAGFASFGLYNITVSGSGAVGGAALTPNLVKTILPTDIDTDWSGSFADSSYFVFDATDGNTMLFLSYTGSVSAGHHKQYLVKLNSLDGSVMWKTAWEDSLGGTKGLPSRDGASETIITTGVFSVLDSNTSNVWSFSTQDGTVTKSQWAIHTSDEGYQAWNDSLGALLYYGPQGPTEASNEWRVLIITSAGSSVALSTIVSDICAPVGLAGGDIGVSTLTDQVEGYLLTNQMTAADGIRPLALAFLFDHNVSDNVLKFVKRGGSSVRTVPNTQLALVDSKNNLFIQETRTQEVDLPYAVALNFLDPNHNYQQATQYARRIVNPYPTMYSKQTTTESLAMVAEPEFMRQLAEKLLYTAWLNRTAYKTKMSWDNIDLDPTDVVTITDTDGSTFLTRTVQNSIGADLSVMMDNVAEDTPTYTSAAVTDGGLGFNQQDLFPPVSTRLFLMDMPLLRDVDDTGQSYTILYDAASGYGPGTWAGTTVWKSSDDVNYNNEPTITTAQGCSWGSAMNALPDVANPFTIDTVNTLTLTMAVGGDNLASDTLVNVCNGANAGVLLNSDGTVEIIQWLTKTLNGDGTYTLSQLLRGRRGTEVFTANHSVGDTFVLLTTGTVKSIKEALSDLNLSRFYKAVTTGTLFAVATPTALVSEGRPLKPYAPVQITATLSGSDIDLAWVRRTRVGGELMPFTGVVPLSEQYKSYQVDIYDPTGMTVLRTLEVDYGAGPTATPGVTYLAADIATDFGSTPTVLIVDVRQMSAVAGRGFGKQTTVTVN